MIHKGPNDRRHDRQMQDDGITRRNNDYPAVAVGDYCPECHLFNFLERTSKDGKKICDSCWREEISKMTQQDKEEPDGGAYREHQWT